MPQPAGQSCKTCYYWVLTTAGSPAALGAPPVYTCRGTTPMMTGILTPRGVVTVSGFPEMPATSWCHKWKTEVALQ